MRYEMGQRTRLLALGAMGVGCALWLSLVGGCGGDDDADHDDGGDHDAKDVGPQSGAVCPTDHSALTYDAFGMQFMTKYCTGCHSTTLHTAAERMNAPADHDFDVEAGIRAVARHIDEKAASGPSATNETMPPPASTGPKPTMAERQQLGEWLACDYPQTD
jgi:hypothetical protein